MKRICNNSTGERIEITLVNNVMIEIATYTNLGTCVKSFFTLKECQFITDALNEILTLAEKNNE